MSLNVTFNGSMYIIPETGEVGWGGNTTSYLVAIAAGALQKTGGSFTLSADTDFGASFGLKSLYYKSRSANIAAAGIVRLNNNSDSINWRNAANSADLALFPNASNLLTFNGSTVYVIGAGTITNADISPSAAIAYSKLNLTNSIVNADINAAAAIDYSKLNVPAGAITYAKLTLTNSVVNADINASAAIAFTKMAAMTASRMTVSDASGFLVASAWNYNATADLTTGPNDELRFQDSAGGDYVAFRAPASVTTHTYDLPIAPGTAGQVLSWQAGGQLQWINAAGGGTINTGNAGFFTYYPTTGTTVDDQALLSTNGTNIILASGQYTSNDGTVLLPVYSFTSDPNTGIYHDGTSGRINFSSDGAEVARIENGQLRILTGNDIIGGTTSRVKLEDGTVSLPPFTFSNDLDTGMYRIGTNSIGITAGGAVAFAADTSGENFYAGGVEIVDVRAQGLGVINGTVGSPSLYFNLDTNTGIYRVGTDSVGIAGNGAAMMTFAPAQMEFYTTGSKIAEFNASRLRPETDNVLQLGSTTLGWKNIYLGDGTVALPAVSFSADNDTGIYRSAANEVAFSTAGVLAALFNSSGQLNMQSHKVVNMALATGASDAAQYSQVKILQVLQASATAEVSTTSGTYTDTGLSLSITPSNTASKILVIVAQNIRHRVLSGGSTNATAGLRLTRGVTDLISDQVSNLTVAATGDYNSTMEQIMMYLDSPGTTSAITYKTRIARNAGTGTIYAQDGGSGTASWITLIEVNGL